MLTPPDFSQFRTYLPSNWFYPELLEAFSWVDDLPSWHHESLSDMINSQIKTAYLPGISDPGTAPQAKGAGSQKGLTTFTGGLEVVDYLNRTLTMTLDIDNYFITYFMFFFQMDAHIRLGQGGDGAYLGPVFTQINDFEQKPIVEISFLNTRIERISDISFDTGDSGALTSRTFDVDIRYEGIRIEHKMNSRYNDGNEIQ